MEFLNPNMLWGSFGVLAPILIHLWNTKKRNTRLWAAMAFLDENQNPHSQSLHLSEYLLLAIRILLILTLVLIFSKPTWKTSTAADKIYILANDPSITDNYKFELETKTCLALENGLPSWRNRKSESSPSIAHLQSLVFEAAQKYPADSVLIACLNPNDGNVWPHIRLPRNVKLEFFENKNLGKTVLINAEGKHEIHQAVKAIKSVYAYNLDENIKGIKILDEPIGFDRELESTNRYFSYSKTDEDFVDRFFEKVKFYSEKPANVETKLVSKNANGKSIPHSDLLILLFIVLLAIERLLA